jgi:DNA-binding LacI/PurR family transcriptional regulator
VSDLAGSHNLDGLIVFSSTLSHEVGLSGVQTFALKFSDLPLCSVGLALPNTPSVTVDNEAGMKQAVRHLIERHEARRIAFINGPAANAESKIRLGAYKSVLEEHGLTYDEQWVLPGTFMMDSGVGALHTLAQRLGPRLDSLDAIVAANDNMAIGAMNALERMGISVPDGVAVVGFDDVEESRLCEPSLTTVRQPLERVGLEAVRRLLQASGGANTPFDMRIDTELVVRQSCGCLVAQQGQRARPPKASQQRFQVAMMGQRERIAAQLGRAARGLFSAAGRGWEQQLLR